MKKEIPTKEQQLSSYIARASIAVSGQNGHKRTLAVARTLFNGFKLSEMETLYWLEQFSKRCDPPWAEKDLKHKVLSASKAAYDKASGYMLIGEHGSNGSNGNGKLVYEQRKPVTADFIAATELYLKGFSCSESDLYEASPIKPSDDFHSDGPLVLDHLFSSGEGVNFVTNYAVNTRSDGAVKADPNDGGTIAERDSLIRSWQMDGTPCSDAGGWLRINPVRGGITDQDVTSFRHMLIEFDSIPVALQISFFARYPAPISAILTSGGHSVHAWIRVDAQSRDEFDDCFIRAQNQLVRLGMDTKNKNPARLSRLPGALRKIGAEQDGRQRILYLNPNPESKAIIA